MPDRRALPVLALTALLIASLALLVPFLMEMAQLSGRHIPTSDVQADYALGLGWAALLGLSICFWPVAETHRNALLRLWGVKVLVTLGAMLFSEWYYEMDAFDYFRNAMEERFQWSHFEWGNGTAVLTLIVRLQTFVLPSYHGVKVTFSMMGLLAVYFTYLAFRLYTKRESLSLLYILGLCPSVLCWASILGKDPLVLLGISLYMLGVARCHARKNLSGLPLILVGMLVSSFIRPWLAGILLLPLGIFAMFGLRSVRARVLVIALSIAAMPLAVSSTMSRLGFKEGEGTVQSIDRQNNFADLGKSTRQLGARDGTVSSLAVATPLGMLSILFRPFPGEVNNPFGVMAGLENTVFLFFAARALWRTRARELRDPFVLWALALLVLWLAGYGAVAAANVGTSVRYRLQIMPLFLWLLVHFSRKRPAPQVTAPPVVGLSAHRLLGAGARIPMIARTGGRP